jgi:hypothetical protein
VLTVVNHFATPEFWHHYRRLPTEVRELADKNFALLRQDPHHPSLRLKKVGSFWSARVGLSYRALARDRAEGLVWFWIGPHGEYDRILAT